MSVELGVSQRVLETEYYMVDLPLIIHEKRRLDALKTLEQINVNGLPYMEKDQQTSILEALREKAGYADHIPGGPDLEGLAKLKSMLSRK